MVSTWGQELAVNCPGKEESFSGAGQEPRGVPDQRGADSPHLGWGRSSARSGLFAIRTAEAENLLGKGSSKRELLEKASPVLGTVLRTGLAARAELVAPTSRSLGRTRSVGAGAAGGEQQLGLRSGTARGAWLRPRLWERPSVPAGVQALR